MLDGTWTVERQLAAVACVQYVVLCVLYVCSRRIVGMNMETVSRPEGMGHRPRTAGTKLLAKY